MLFIIGNMNTQLVSACLLALVATALTEAPGPYPAASGPYPPSGWKPSGQRLELPARQQVSTVYGPPPQAYGPPDDQYGPPPPPTEAATEAATEPTTEPAAEEATPPPAVAEQLRDGGVYYVLLQDGQLQMVRYRTAPLRLQKQKSQRQQKASDADKKNKAQKQAQLLQVQAHQAQFQPARIQQQTSRVNVQPARNNAQSAQLNQQPQPFHYVEIQKSHEIEVAQPPPEQAPKGFVANVQYRDVDPISSPIFALNSAPLVRILKK